MSLLSLVAAALIVPQGLADEFDAPLLVRGTVRDTAGEPVVGARARLELSSRSSRFLRLAAPELHRLPPIVVRADGEFVLALTERHRQILGAHVGPLRLVVEAPDHHFYGEPLGLGLEGYLGSDVVLAPVTDGERTILRPTQELRRGIVLIERRIGDGDVSYRTLPIPPDGVVSCAVETVPSPLYWGGHWQVETFATLARILAPGRTTAPTVITGGSDWKPGPFVGGARSLTVRGADDSALRELRGAYSCPDGVTRWFRATDPDRLRSDAALTLVAVVAAGTRAIRVADGMNTVELAPLAEQRDVSIRVVDPEGRPVPGVVARVEPLVAAVAPQRRRARPIVADASGTIVVPAGRLRDVVTVEVRAPGFHAEVVFDPRPGAGRADPVVELQPGSTGSLRVQVVDDEGKPVRDALVLVPDAALTLCPIPDRPWRSDAGGVVTITHLTPGAHSVTIDGTHSVAQTKKVVVDPDQETDLEVVLPAAVEFRVVTVDGDGHRVPFTPLRLTGPDNRVRNHRAVSDSRGRLVARIDARDGTVGVQLPSRGRVVVEDVATVCELVVDRPVLGQIRAPADAWRARIVTLRGGGGASSSGADVPPPLIERSGRFLIRAFDNDSRIRVGLGTGPPLRLDLAELARGLHRRVDIDQRVIVRRVPLRVLGLEGAQLERARVQPTSPHYSGNMYSNGIGNCLVVDGDAAMFVARDRGEWTARLLHPEFLAAEFRVPAAEADPDEPIEVQLERATRVTLRALLTEAPKGLRRVSVRVRDLPNRGIKMYVQDLLAVPPDAQVGQRVDVTLPCGLAPGRYELHLSGSGLEDLKEEVEVAAGVDVVVGG